jgi:hypothetical protein
MVTWPGCFWNLPIALKKIIIIQTLKKIKMNKQQFFDLLRQELKAKTLWQSSVKDQPFLLSAYSVNAKVIIVQEFNKSEGCLIYFPESFVNPSGGNTWKESFDFIKQNCGELLTY